MLGDAAFAFLRSRLRIFPSLVCKSLELRSQKMLNVFSVHLRLVSDIK
jgi:hypothetical protein